MKKKLTFIFILITFSMLGIIYSQFKLMLNVFYDNAEVVGSKASNALNWALFNRRNEQNREILISVGREFQSAYKRVEVRFSILPDSLSIYPLEVSDTNQFKPLNKNFKLRRRIGRASLYLPVRRPTELKKIIKDERAIRIFDSLFTIKKSFCEFVSNRGDTVRILKHLKTALLKARMGEFKDKIKLNFRCGPDKPSTHYEIGETEHLEYQPGGLSYYASIPHGNKLWVNASYRSAEDILISKILGPIFWSVALILITIVAYIYLFVIILKQKRLAEMKDDFINNMTHELKTPIAIISAAVEGMQNFNALQDKEKTIRYLETSRKELNRLNDLVTKVLHMASYEKKDIQLSLEKIEMDELMTDIIESFKNHSDKALNITYKNASSVKYLEADPVHFRNAVSNLVDNAIKYSGDQVDISINCYADGKYVKISIIDKGIGIPSSQLNQIFEKFHRVPTGNIHNVKGTGLGLSYVKYIIEKHGGTVSVKSELNKGSEFIISVPSNS